MGRIVIVNGSPHEGGYWNNEVRGSALFLNTHCAAAIEIARAHERNDRIYLNVAGDVGLLRGPLALSGWRRNRDFFTLRFQGIDVIAVPMLGAEALKVTKALRRGQHLVLCEGANVTHVNLENRPQPPPETVEDLLSLAGVSLLADD